ncbi:MAG TPA: hypothetical protein VGE60_04865 [Telluria sp.]
MNRIATFCIGAAIAGSSLAGPPEAANRFNGIGRPCAGVLDLRDAAISWKTSFSSCPATAYAILDGYHDKTKTSIAFELAEITHECKFRVISLVQRESGSGQPAWEATGYGTRDAYWEDKRSGFANKAPDTMSCPLLRAP